MTMPPCPIEDVLLAFSEGQLSPSEAQGVEIHLDACRACRTLMAELGRALASDGTNTPLPWARQLR